METNPILKNITDYLIEEVSAEEEELIGASGCNTDDAGDAKDPASSDVTLETDDKLLKVGGASCRSGAACFMKACIYTCVCVQVLDRLLLYLRLVHSVDYYNFCEYPAEDEMPHRCGLIHVRGPLPVGKITATEGTHTHTLQISRSWYISRKTGKQLYAGHIKSFSPVNKTHLPEVCHSSL